MIRAVLVDDETKSLKTLESLLRRYCPTVEIVGYANGVDAGIEVIQSQQPDVVFLDIQMPDGSGFRLLEALEPVSFHVIFTTAFDQYAIKAIRYSALDYLLKPIVPQDLVNAVDTLEKRQRIEEQSTGIRTLIDNHYRAADKPAKIVLSTAEKIHVVEVSNIIRCESDNYYTMFYFKSAKRLLVSRTLKEIEELLSPHHFLRPHKSHLINIAYIDSFVKADGGYIVLKDGSKIPVSRRKRESVLEIINALQA